MKNEEQKDEEEDDGFIFIPPCFLIPRKGGGWHFPSGSAFDDMWAMKMTAYTFGGGLVLAVIIILLCNWLG